MSHMLMPNDTLISDDVWELLQFNISEIHCKNQERAIVVFSGGFDSTVALWWALFHYKSVRVIVVDYNQPHKEEILYAKRIAALVGFELDLIKLDIPVDFWGINNNLTRGQAGLMTCIAALDIGTNGSDIVHGILKTDNYPDCDRDYLDTLAAILPSYRDEGEIGIATPLRAVDDKQSVCIMGFLYGAPIKWTWSCRNPENSKPCGKCLPCRARNAIYDGMTNRYGISYEEIDAWQNVLGSPIHPKFREPTHELSILVQAFIELGGLNKCQPGWKYIGPDQEWRIATLIRNPDVLDFSGRNQGEICNCVEIHGEFEDGVWWQIVICEDHSVAYTKNMPGMEVIERLFKDKLIDLTFGER